MSKDKKRSIDESNKKETLFYYEIIGIIIIILSLVLVLRLGFVGNWLYIIFKVAFGDYYFICLFFLLYLGFYFLFMHKAFSIKNQLFVGIIFVYFGVMIFSHIPVHNYVLKKEGSYLDNTWNIYYLFITTGKASVLGGGLIGAILFYLFFRLFGLVGVCIIAVLVIMLGISMALNVSIGDIFKGGFNKAKIFVGFTKKFNNFFKYELGGQPHEKNHGDFYNRKLQVPLKILEDYKNDINYEFQVKLSSETKSLINSIFSNNRLDYKVIDVIVSYKVTTYKYIIFNDFNSYDLLKKIKRVVTGEILFGKEQNKVMIQINNEHKQLLCLRNVLFTQTNLYNNFIIPLGMDYKNNLIEMNTSKYGGVLVISDNYNELTNFCLAFIFSLLVKNNVSLFNVNIFDPDLMFESLHCFCIQDKLTDVIDYLDLLKTDIDERLHLFEKYNVNTIDEYNLKMELEDNKQFLKRRFIIISAIGYQNVTFEDRIFYLIQAGMRCGYFIIQLSDGSDISNIINSIYEYKVLLYCEHCQTFPNTNALMVDGDSFISISNKDIRTTIPRVTDIDIEKVKNYVK